MGQRKVNKKTNWFYLFEGADSIISEKYLEISYNNGLRAIGPAHYGPGTYAHGTDSDSIGIKGKRLLKINELEMILDVSHLCDKSFWETIDYYKGKIWASHSNCRALVLTTDNFQIFK